MNSRLYLFIAGLFFIVLNVSAGGVDDVLHLPDDTLKATRLAELSSSMLKRGAADSALQVNNKLIALLEKLQNTERVPDVYNDRQKIYKSKGDTVNAFKSLITALEKCRSSNNTLAVSGCYRNIALYYFAAGRFQDAIPYAQQGLKSGDSIKDPLKYMSLLNNLGTCNSNLGEYTAAAGYLLRAMRLAESISDSFRVAVISNNISQLYNRIEDYTKAREYVLRSINYSANNPATLKNALTNLGYIYLEHESKPDSALVYYQKAASISADQGDKLLLGMCYQNISSAFRKLKLNDSADIYIEKALTIAFEINDNKSIAGTLNIMGASYREKYLATKNNSFLKKAIAAYEKALPYAEESDDAMTRQAVYQGLSMVYNESTDYRNAYIYSNKYAALQDSLHNAEILNSTTRLETKYQTEKRDREIAEGKIALQQRNLELAAKDAFSNKLIAGIALLFIVLISGIIYYRQRQKIAIQQREFEKHKAVEQTRAIIAGELHDDVGASLSSVQFMSSFALKAMDNNHQEAKSWLQQIEGNTGKIVDDIRDIVWTLNPTNDNAVELISRMRHFATQLLEPKNINFELNVDDTAVGAIDNLLSRRNVFLIFKEALTNSARYSNAANIKIAITSGAGKLQMTVADDGNGFDTSATRTGNGLSNMEKRAAALNGKINIESSQEGTILTLNC